MSNLSDFVLSNTVDTATTFSSNADVYFDGTLVSSSTPVEKEYCGGGQIICKASSVAWIVAPRCAEVSRAWADRDDAVTTANTCTGFSGWFVPTIAQLQNPGYSCRVNWEYPEFAAYNSASYWSSTQRNATNAYDLSMSSGTSNTSVHNKTNTSCVRAFRCVTY